MHSQKVAVWCGTTPEAKPLLQTKVSDRVMFGRRVKFRYMTLKQSNNSNAGIGLEHVVHSILDNCHNKAHFKLSEKSLIFKKLVKLNMIVIHLHIR